MPARPGLSERISWGRLLESRESLKIVGLDNLNENYDPSLKEYRLRMIEAKAKEHPEHRYVFVRGDLANKALIDRVFEENKPDIVVNLAAQAGAKD